MRRNLLLAAVLLTPAGIGRAGAQSLLSSQGLGLPLEPMGARSYALGGVSLGLPGPEISWSNPAGAVGLPAGGLLTAFQYDSYSATVRQESAVGGSAARLPLLLAAFPFGDRWAVSAGFGGFLDQRWGATQRDSLVLGSDSISIVDVVRSDGGVSRFRVAAARRLLPSLSLGLGADLYSGGVRRVAGRIFPNEAEPTCCTTTWRYSGVGAVTSLDWNPGAALSVSASASFGGTLRAEAQDSSGRDRSYALPVRAEAGASGRVSPNLLVAATARWAGWSRLDTRLAPVGGARDTWGAGGGLEWDALQLLGRALPLRVGARYRTLPFGGTLVPGAEASERSYSLGSGLELGGGAARGDLTLERGSRGDTGDGLHESFWRIVFSASVLGQ